METSSSKTDGSPTEDRRKLRWEREVGANAVDGEVA